MTIIVYQDRKLFVDTTTFTDYSDAVPQVKWKVSHSHSRVDAFAGSQEDIAAVAGGEQKQENMPTELAVVSLRVSGEKDGVVLLYGENGGMLYPVIPLDDTPILFGNNALRACVKNYMDTVYTWNAPLLIEMTKAGFFPAVVELSPEDGYNYLHKLSGSEKLPSALALS